MKKINIRKLYYHIRHNYITLNNVVIAVAFLIAASWAWGSVGVMQRNYALQEEINTKNQQEQVADLDNQTLQLQQKYYQSSEYLEVQAKRRLNLAIPGEKLLIMPPNSQVAKNEDIAPTDTPVQVKETGNFAQWMNFIFGSKSTGQS